MIIMIMIIIKVIIIIIIIILVLIIINAMPVVSAKQPCIFPRASVSTE